MPAETRAKRKAWIAALLSLGAPGVGHVYTGAPRQGLAILLLLPLLGYAASLFLVSLRGAVVVPGLVLGMVCFWTGVIVDAVRRARRIGSGYTLRWFNRCYVYAALWFGSGTVASLQLDWTRMSMVQAFSIPTSAMEPAILVGDYILVDKRDFRDGRHAVETGDIVIVNSATWMEEPFMSRIVAEPGDRLNGEIVPEDSYYVWFDDWDAPGESGPLGPLPRAAFVGEIAQVYWSWDAERRRGRWERLGHRPQ